jgi:hypothetical protein
MPLHHESQEAGHPLVANETRASKYSLHVLAHRLVNDLKIDRLAGLEIDLWRNDELS